MALTNDEQVEQYLSAKRELKIVERELSEADAVIGSDLRAYGCEFYSRVLTMEERDEVFAVIKRILEEKYEHMSAEIEEMLK